MIYGSVCSGIESATCAWHPLGWKAAFYSEIDRFPSALLRHHYPNTPNFGDMNAFKEWPDAAIDLLVGGTPCQSFSVAGLRKGLDDPRGNLTLVYLAIAARYRPRWLVWENVPGVLSDDGGRTFGTFLGGLAKLGYGFAYRVLDAQYFGLAQRRQRVFVVGYLGDWRRPGAVLLESEGLRGDPAPSREARQGITHDVAGSLTGSGRGVPRPGETRGQDPVIPILEAGARPGTSTTDRRAGMGVGAPGDPMYTLQAGKQHAIAHALRADGFDASEDGTGRRTPLVPMAFTCYGADATSELAPTLRAMGHHHSHANAGGQLAVAFGGNNQRGPIDVATARNGHAVPHGRLDFESETFAVQVCPTLRAGGNSTGGDRPPGTDVDTSDSLVVRSVALRGRDGGATAEMGDDLAGAVRASQGGGDKPHVLTQYRVRRLIPNECEILQGFKPGYTNIPYRNGTAADGPRYKSIGNSMAVPCMSWIGRRIQMVENLG